VWVLWYLRGYLHYDRFLLIRTVQHLDKRESFSLLLMGSKGVSFALCLGGAAFLPLLPFLLYRRRSITLIGVFFGLVGAGTQLWIEGWYWGHALLFGILLASGVVVLIASFEFLWMGEQEAALGQRAGIYRHVLLFWLLGIVAAAILVYPSGSVRYSLLAFPPALIAFLWASETRRQVSRRLWGMAVALTLIFSLTLSWADYQTAGIYQRQARDLVRQYGGQGRTIWFASEWEFRYYLKEQGAKILAGTVLGPQVGDILIKPYVSFPYRTLFDGSEYLLLLEQRPAGAFPYIRLMDFDSHAGFYSTAWGLLPYSISLSERWEHFNIYQVIKVYDGPIPEPEKHY